MGILARDDRQLVLNNMSGSLHAQRCVKAPIEGDSCYRVSSKPRRRGKARAFGTAGDQLKVR